MVHESKSPKRLKSPMTRVGSFVIVGAMSAGLLAGCGEKSTGSRGRQNAHFYIIDAGGDVPAKENAIEKKIEEYTKTDVNVQWIPQSAFDDKVNVMVASGEMPTIMRVNYVPTTFNAAKTGCSGNSGLI